MHNQCYLSYKSFQVHRSNVRGNTNSLRKTLSPLLADILKLLFAEYSDNFISFFKYKECLAQARQSFLHLDCKIIFCTIWHNLICLAPTYWELKGMTMQALQAKENKKKGGILLL